jgi:hypothetical protein
MEELMKYDGNPTNFIKTVNDIPEGREVKVNKFADNSKYIPISFLEMKLDELFIGLWQTENFKTQIVANEIIGSLELSYLHPNFKVWIKRVGVGGVLIRQKKDANITDIEAKIKNALTMDYPHLKAMCFRNACQSIGKLFGRDLNREYADIYKEYEPPEETIPREKAESIHNALQISNILTDLESKRKWTVFCHQNKITKISQIKVSQCQLVVNYIKDNTI